MRGVTIGKRRPVPSLTVAAAATLLALGACGGDDKIDSGALEDEIQNGLVEETGIEPSAVECPDDIEAEEGSEFDCTATAEDGTEATVEITLTDDDGSFDWYVPPEQFE